MFTQIWEYLPWIAILSLSTGYWLQVLKIRKHKEVRDISLPGNILLALGFLIMSIKAIEQKSLIFFVKQIMTFIPVAMIIKYIFKYKNEHWQEEDPKYCNGCKEILEHNWKFCPYCQLERPSSNSNKDLASSVSISSTEETPNE